MLNIFFVLNRWAKQRIVHTADVDNKYENYFSRRFYSSNLKSKPKNEAVMNYTFPFFKDVKAALDNFGIDYEISLTYICKSSFIIKEDYYPAYNPAHYDYRYENSSTGDELVLQFVPVLRVKLHFPKVVISNSKNQNHEIRDLFVKFDIHTSGMIYHLQGCRTAVTQLEKKVNYRHSHLATAYKLCDYTTFCLGSDSAVGFAKIMVEEAIKNKAYDLSEITLLYLNTIKAYIHYESIEGGPYIKMERITQDLPKEITSYDFNILEDGYSELLRAFLNYKQIGLSAYVKNNNLVYKNNNISTIKKDVFEQLIFSPEIITSYVNERFKASFLDYSYHGVPLSLRQYITFGTEDNVDESRYEFFAGKKYYATILVDNKIDNPDDIKVTVKPTIKNYAYNRFLLQI